MVMRGGRLSFVGDSHDRPTPNHRKFVLDDLKAAGVRGEGLGDCRRSLALFSQGSIQAKPLITHHFPLEKVNEAYGYLYSAQGRGSQGNPPSQWLIGWRNFFTPWH